MCVEDVLAEVSGCCASGTESKPHLLTEILEGRIELLLAMLVFVHQEIVHVDRLDHAIECRKIALGGRDSIPARLTGHPQLDAAILGLAVSIVDDIVDDDSLRRRVWVEHCKETSGQLEHDLTCTTR